MRAALLLLLVPFCVAAEPVVIINPDGTAAYWDGESDTAVSVRVVRVTGEPPPDPPTDPDDPDPPPKSSLARDVQNWASEVNDPAGAYIWSRVYALVAEAISDAENPSVDDMAKLVKQATKAAMDEMLIRYHVEWKSVDQKIGEALNKRLILANADKGEWVKALQEVSDGFKAVSGAEDAARLDPDVLDRIERIIRIVLMLIRMFGSGGL